MNRLFYLSSGNRLSIKDYDKIVNNQLFYATFFYTLYNSNEDSFKLSYFTYEQYLEHLKVQGTEMNDVLDYE